MKILSANNPTSSKRVIIFFGLVMITVITSSLYAQINITPGTSMVLNGNVSLVINNAALQNNGTFAAGNSTVNFSGHKDTLLSYVSGDATTTFNNLAVSKSAYGVALKSAVAVKNILSVNAGNLYTDSNLTLRSTEALTASVAAVAAGSNIIGKANVERYVPSRRAWRLMTAPVTNGNTIFESWQNKGIYATGAGTIITGPNPSGANGNGLDNSAQNTSSMKGFNYSTQQFTKVLNTKVAISQGNNGSPDNTGYFIFVRGDRNPENTNISNVNNTTLTTTGILQTGAQTFPASSVVNGYTLIGNPYASPVNFDNVTRTNLMKRFYVWDPSLNTVGGYVMMDDLNNDGVYTKSVAGSTQTKEIQSGQAFFVQTNSNGAAAITFNETSKPGYNSNSKLKAAKATTATGDLSGQVITSLNLLNTDNTTILADGVIAEFDNSYGAGIDSDDAAKFSNTNENISIVRNNVLLAAERRPSPTSADTLYFRLTTTTQRDYQFKIEVNGLKHKGLKAFLEDSYLGTSTPVSLAGTTTINFTINSETGSASVNRFKIVFKSVVTTSVVTIKTTNAYQRSSNSTAGPKAIAEKSAGSFSIYPNPVTGNVINLQMNNQPAGKYQVRLTNITGQVIFVKTIQSNGGNSTEALSAGSTLMAGIYQLEIIGQDNSHHTQKVIVE